MGQPDFEPLRQAYGITVNLNSEIANLSQNYIDKKGSFLELYFIEKWIDLKKIGYIRISTDDQSEQLQRDALIQAGCDEIFADIGVSGSLKKRPALDQALQSLQRGDHLVVWKLDRLGRRFLHLVQVLNDIYEKQIRFRSLTDGIDTDTPLGRLQFAMIAAFAEYEWELISERTKAGMRSARAKGVRLGRPRKDSSDI